MNELEATARLGSILDVVENEIQALDALGDERLNVGPEQVGSAGRGLVAEG